MYQVPMPLTLDLSLSAIKHNPEFVVNRDGALATIYYRWYESTSFFPGPNDSSVVDSLIRRNLRGTIFSLLNGEAISLPFHKFFNLDENTEVQLDEVIKREKDLVKITEKLDGSMIHFFMHPTKKILLSATRKSYRTPQAQAALELLEKDKDCYEKVKKLVLDGWTPIFEYISPRNRIVIEYPASQLVYLVSRNRFTGNYFYHDFPIVPRSFKSPLRDIFDYIKEQEFMEGVVLHFENPYLFVKVKTPWYLVRHKFFASSLPKYKFYEAVLNNMFDDLVANSVGEMREVLTDINNQVMQDIEGSYKELTTRFRRYLKELGMDTVPEEERKDPNLRKRFAQYVTKVAPNYLPEMMLLFLNGDIYDRIKKKLLEEYKEKYRGPLFDFYSDGRTP